MKKARYGLSVLMALALVLTGLSPVLASPQESVAGGNQLTVAEAEAVAQPTQRTVAEVEALIATALGDERDADEATVFIEIEGVEGAALGALSRDAVVSTLRAHATTTQEPIIAWLVDNGAEVLNTFWLNNLILVTLDPEILPQLFLEFPEVEDVYPNFQVTIPEPTEVLTVEGEVTVESPPPTWGVARVRAPAVWAEGIDGEGIRIAVLDTGVHIAHPDLVGRMWTDDPANPEFPGGWIHFNAAGHRVVGSVPHDTHWHGTHCSGTALGGATGPAAIGVAPGAWLMHALVLPGGGGTWAQIIAGMQWTIAPTDDAGNPAGEPADVVSMSFGATGFHGAMIAPINNMIAAGIVPVASIGNAGPGTSGSPGNVFGSFSLGATNVADAVATWSSGQVVHWPASHPEPYIVPDFAAPGVAVLSAMPPATWGLASGTSMSAPHLAGTVALMLQHRPDLTLDEIYERLKVTACDLGAPGQDIRFGWGIIDAYDATVFDSGIVGMVTDTETDAPLAGAAVYAEGVGTVFTDAAGNYTARLWPGVYTLIVSAFGYEGATAEVTVVAGAFTEQDFALVPLPTGFIAGTVTDIETDAAIAGAVITVLGTPLTAVTGADGTYSLEAPVGTYDVRAAAEGYLGAIAYGVVVSEEETTTVDFALEPGLAVAIIGDWAGQLEALLDARGHLAEPRDWDVIADMADYDAVVVNRLTDPGKTAFLSFLAEAEEHGVGLLFTSNWSWMWPWGIRLLQLHREDPATQEHDWNDGPVFYKVTMSHPIFAGWEVGEKVTIVHGADNDHAWFGGYSGLTAANLGSTALGVRGGGMGFTVLENNAHLLLAGLGPQSFTNVAHWTDDGRTIFVRGLEWVADPPRLALDPPKGGEDHEVVVSGVNFPRDKAGTITAIPEGIIAPTGFVADENGEFAVPVTILMSAPPGETMDALFLATVDGMVQTTAPFTVLPPPAIALTPDYGGPGTEVTVEGEGFPINTLGIVYAIEPGGDWLEFPQGVEDLALLPASVITPIPFVTDGDGEFQVTATIRADAPQGEATFVANVAGFVATAPFMVPFDPTIVLTPTSGYGGTQVTIAGEWFEANLLGYISAEDVINPVPFETDEDGKFEVTATILLDAPLGEVTFYAMEAETVLATAQYEVIVAPPFNFSLAVAPAAATVTQGKAVTAAVTATRVAGITQEVTLTAALPAGVTGITVTFAPPAGNPTFTSTMTIAAAATATVGTHAITITGTGAGGLVRTVTFTLTVGLGPIDFSLAVVPTAATVTQGKAVTAAVTATLVAGITEVVTLTAALPAGVTGITVTFAPTSGTPTFGSTMTITTTAAATVGVHPITITGTGVRGLVRTTTFTLTVTDFDFSLSVHPKTRTITQGGVTMATVSAVLLRGTSEEVALTAQLPAGVEGLDIVFTPSSGEPLFGSIMSIAAANTATVGTYAITITGTGASGLVRTTTLTLTVNPLPFDFSLAVEPTAATIARGAEEVTAAVTATLEAGGIPLDIANVQEVTLTAALPAGVAGITVTFDPAAGYPTFESAMTIAAAATATLGVHPITITATSAPGGLVRTTTLTLTVEEGPFDFSLAVAPAAATVTQGEAVTAAVTATHLAGITEEVTLTAALPAGAAGITVTFAPAVGEPTFVSTMTIAAAADATAGEHIITITGTGAGGLVRTTTFTLTVEVPPFDFGLAVEPTAAAIAQGEGVTAAVTATHLAGIIEEVTLTAQLPAGVAGITITFDPSSGEPTFESAMTIAALNTATLGTHAITITGTSATETETVTFTLTVTLPGYDITLQPGWNLISLPLIPEDPAIEAVLAGILANVIRVWHYDAETQVWKSFGPGGAPDTLTEMVDGKGYWINMAAAATLTVVGMEMPPPPALPPQYPVFEGWNHIGFRSTTPMTVDDYLGPAIMEIFERMWGFDAAAGWFRVLPGDDLEPGRGYWLAVSADGTIFSAGVPE